MVFWSCTEDLEGSRAGLLLGRWNWQSGEVWGKDMG